MTQEWVTVHWRAVDKSLPNAYWLKWSRRSRPRKQGSPGGPFCLQHLPWPPASVWNGSRTSPVGMHVLPQSPQGNVHHTDAFFQAKLRGTEWGHWFLSFCQGNSNGVTCLLLWCGSCHPAGHMGYQFCWPCTLTSSEEAHVTQIWDGYLTVSLYWMWDIRQGI